MLAVEVFVSRQRVNLLVESFSPRRKMRCGFVVVGVVRVQSECLLAIWAFPYGEVDFQVQAVRRPVKKFMFEGT